MKKQPEYNLQVAVCKFLKLQYPNVMFLSDTIASVRLTEPQKRRNYAIQNQRFKCPDLLILKPNKNYKGLFIELKVVTPFKIDGQVKASKDNHLLNQWLTLQDLKKLGYFAVFSWSLEMTVDIINKYMNNEIKLLI